MVAPRRAAVRRRIGFLVLLQLVPWSVGTLGCGRVDVPGKVMVREAALHLTDGVPGEELSGSFVLWNGGTQSLQITKLEAECGCSRLEVSSKRLLPGAEAVLHITVRLKPDGQPLQFPVRVFTSDPETPVTVLTVRAEAVAAPVETEPAQAAFGDVTVGSQPVRQLMLRKPGGEPWPAEEAVEVSVSSGLVKARIIPVTEGVRAPTLALEVEVRRDLPTGPFSDTLTLWPANSKRGVLVTVQGSVVPRLVVSPNVLYFDDVERRTEPMTRQVLVRRTDGKPLSRLQRWTAPEGFQVQEVGKAGAGKGSDVRKLVRVTLDPPRVLRDLKGGTLRLWLEDEAEPLQVRVLVAAASKDGAGAP